MAPRTGQLDEISVMLGELKGTVEGIEKYVHEGRHGVNNLSQKFDALAVKIASDIAAVEARLDARLQAVEMKQSTWTGAKLLAAWIVQTVIAAIVAIFAIRGAGR